MADELNRTNNDIIRSIINDTCEIGHTEWEIGENLYEGRTYQAERIKTLLRKAYNAGVRDSKASRSDYKAFEEFLQTRE